jgi:hypothetical protein
MVLLVMRVATRYAVVRVAVVVFILSMVLLVMRVATRFAVVRVAVLMVSGVIVAAIAFLSALLREKSHTILVPSWDEIGLDEKHTRPWMRRAQCVFDVMQQLNAMLRLQRSRNIDIYN